MLTDSLYGEDDFLHSDLQLHKPFNECEYIRYYYYLCSPRLSTLIFPVALLHHCISTITIFALLFTTHHLPVLGEITPVIHFPKLDYPRLPLLLTIPLSTTHASPKPNCSLIFLESFRKNLTKGLYVTQLQTIPPGVSESIYTFKLVEMTCELEGIPVSVCIFLFNPHLDLYVCVIFTG